MNRSCIRCGLVQQVRKDAIEVEALDFGNGRMFYPLLVDLDKFDTKECVCKQTFWYWKK